MTAPAESNVKKIDDIKALKSTYARILAVAHLLTTMDVPALVSLGNTVGEDVSMLYGDHFQSFPDDFTFEELTRHQALLIERLKLDGAQEVAPSRIHLIN